MSRSNAAVKANRTRRARKDFYNSYPETAAIAETLLNGHSTKATAKWFSIPVSSVAAVLANLNRYGMFRRMAGSCNF